MDVLKTVIAFVFALVGFSGISQSVLDEYKYVIVPKRFENFKNANEYQTSTLVKYLFNGKGFNAIYDDDLPLDLRVNRCLGLMVQLQDDSNMFTTKTIIVLKDCNGKEVFRTMEGVSKKKEYKEAYSEAIKEAMRSFNGINYAYNGKTESQDTITVSFKNDVKRVEEKTKDEDTKVNAEKKRTKMNPNPAITQMATETTQYYKDNTPVDSKFEKGVGGKAALKNNVEKSNMSDVWYAQPTENGYQLVDSSPKIQMNLLKSSLDTVYMARTDSNTGMVYKKEGVWIFEYYVNDKLVQQQLNIKF